MIAFWAYIAALVILVALGAILSVRGDRVTMSELQEHMLSKQLKDARDKAEAAHEKAWTQGI